MKCSSCGTENAPEYKYCGTCGTPLYNPMTGTPKPYSGIPAPIKSPSCCTLTTALYASLFIACSLIIVILALPQSPKTDTSESIMAWIKAKQFVTDRLKAPVTARFDDCSLEKCVTPLGKNRYRVSSYVDAQNSFGALIRTHWITVVREDGDMWYLESLDFP